MSVGGTSAPRESRAVLRSPTVRRAALLTTVLVLVLVCATAVAAPRSRGPVGPALAASGAERVVDGRSARPASARARVRRALRKALGDRAIVAVDDKTGRPRLLARRGGFLTGPSGRRPADVALDYVRARGQGLGIDPGDLASLALVRAYRSGSGAVHIQWEQSYRGIPLFGSGLSANVDAHGRLINIGGAPRPDLAVASVDPHLSALDALLAAGRDAGVAVVPGRPSATGSSDRLTTFSAGHRASLTLFDGQRVKLAWRLLLRGDADQVYDAVVDAQTGETLYRASLVRHATARVFDHYPGAPFGGNQVDRVLPDSWLSSAATSLSGNYAHVYSDPSDANQALGVPDPNPPLADEIPPSSPGAWLYTQDARPATSARQFCPATPGCSWNSIDPAAGFGWETNREQAGTQLFYFVNLYHDHLRGAPGIGFDVASGNFEGGDRVIAQVDDGATTDTGPFDDFPDCNHINNAFVIPVPDGMPLVMQLYLWSNACTGTTDVYDVNPADDGLVVYHEYTHGMTNRLVTDAAGMSALNGAQSGAMDEGFADWYALDLLNLQGFRPDTAAPAELGSGDYEHTQLRTQAFDCPVGVTAAGCPGTGGAGPGGYTYGDFAKILGSDEVHADGEIWVETLWDLRSRLIADHGLSDGVNRTRALVTDGLRLAPDAPTYLDMRNAILQADLNRGFGDKDRIWAVFAARGMGFLATTTGSDDTSPTEDFSLPPSPPPGPAADTTAPAVSRVSVTRRRFAVGSKPTARDSRTTARKKRAPRGTAFRFRLSERATVRIALQRALPGRVVGGRCRPATRRLRTRRRCTRYVSAGTLVRRRLGSGARKVTFSGRVGRRALRLGAHRAAISATDTAGNRSQPRRIGFRILRS